MICGVPVSLLLLALSSPTEPSQEWSRFLGPNGSCRIESSPLPDALDPESTLLWRTEIAGGYSSPIVVGDHILLTAADKENLLTICLDRTTGEERWTRLIPFHGKRPGANSPAAPTPVSDGKAVYAVFHDHGVAAYDLEGEDLWSAPIGPFTIPHGFSSSPLLHDDILLLQVDQDSGSYVIAWDKRTGEERWKVDRPGVTHAYGSPALYVPEQGPAQLIISGPFRVSGHSLKDGQPIWWANAGSPTPMTTPMIVGDRAIICSYAAAGAESGLPNISGSFADALEARDKNDDGRLGPDEFDSKLLQSAFFVFDLDDDGFFDERDWDYLSKHCRGSGGLYSIKLDGKGDVTESHILWKYDQRRGLSETTSPLVIDDEILLLKSGGLLSAFDLETGELDRIERVGESDQYWATPLFADGKIYLASLSGLVTVLAADGEWNKLSSTSLDEATWSTPAISDGRIFVRTQKALYCFGLTEGR
jgi:outer membrane protein assembly factor BamB